MNRKLAASMLLGLTLFDALASLIFWTAKGANTGWTKTQVEVVKVDEVTGIEGRSWEKRFVPGFELLGTCWLGAGAMATIAILIRKEDNKNQPS